MLLIGYLFGVRSERQLMREIQVNVAYRWFLGLRLTDKVPDASTISQNRRRRFNETTVFQEIFDEIVLQAMGHGLVDGTVLYTDSTHLKANANKNKADVALVQRSRADYLAALDEDVAADRAAHGKRPARSTLADEAPAEKEIKVSRTDPEAGYMIREGKPKGFFYLDHRTVDGRHAIITDTHATPADVHDVRPYLARLDRQIERFGFDPFAVGLDAGYASAAIAKGLDDRGIRGCVGYARPAHREGYLRKRDFAWLGSETDAYQCPEGQILDYATTDKHGYRHYKSDPAICRACPLLASCTASRNTQKIVTRHVWQDAKDRVDANRLTAWGKRIYKRRKETVERSFADAKQLHGHRYARMRGLLRWPSSACSPPPPRTSRRSP